MKRLDLERKMKKLGWRFSHHGGDHDRWTNGKEQESVPRHKEIKEYLAKKILKKVEDNPPQEE